MRITFFGVRPTERGYLETYVQTTLPNDQITLLNERLTLEQIPSDTTAEVISVFIECKVTKEVIEKFTNLKLIVARSTGYDNIDVAACATQGITVCNVPSYGEHTVAEFTFALILTLSRKMFDCVARVKVTRGFSKEGLIGFDLMGKTLGVIGTGRIGQHVIQIAKGFGMNVVAHDAFPRPELQSQLGFTYVPIETLLATSDIITLHVPAIKETQHMINAEALAKMKNGAYIINTSRGMVIDTAALKDSLRNGHLAGAGLDVLEDETGPVDSELLNMPNVVITPHNAFDTKEAIERILETTLQNIATFEKGPPQNIAK